MADQWRADCLSIEGHPVVHTPYLDSLALHGVRFSQAYSETPTCIPSRAGLYTGLKQTTHGRVGYLDGVAWNYPTTIASEFTRNGYQTQAIGKMHVFPERSQIGFQNVILHDGFINHPRSQHHDYDEIDDYIPWLREQYGVHADYFEHGVHCNSNITRPWDKPEHLHPTNFVTSQAVQFVKRRDPRKPFFLFLSYVRPHPPYDPPAWALEQYLNVDMPEIPLGNWESMLDQWEDSRNPNCKAGDLSTEQLQRCRAGYYGLITHIDHQINRLIWTLKEYNQLDNTYILFLSDHGEMLGDHRMYSKAYPYDGSARVPLILAGPRNSDLLQNVRLEPIVALRDVMPTLLDCAGIPIPEHVEGRSLLPFARGEKLSWREYIHGEHIVFGQSMHWVTDGHEKYIWMSGSGREQLFNLDEDPSELRDLGISGGAEERIKYWKSIFVDELKDREEGFVQDGKLVTGRPVHPCLEKLRLETNMDFYDRSDWHNRGAIT
jgi:arylsulfatase